MSTARKRAAVASEPFFGFSAWEKQYFLAAFIEDMTIAVRDAYLMPAEEQAARLKSWNELLHRVAGNLRALLADSADRFPDEVLFDMIRATARDEQLGPQIKWAIESAYESLERMRKAKSSAMPKIAAH